MSDVAAHEQHETIRLVWHYEAHHPRAGDPYYKYFERARVRLKKQGLLRCVVNNEDCSGQIELHHSHVEFADQNSISVPRLNKLLGLHLTEESFKRWVEEPGNLEPLCHAHHMAKVAVHKIPAAAWDVVRAHKPGLRPVEVL